MNLINLEVDKLDRPISKHKKITNELMFFFFFICFEKYVKIRKIINKLLSIYVQFVSISVYVID